MADIDMIPRSYRDRVRLRHTLRRVGGALALVLLCAGAGHVALRWRAAALAQEASQLRAAASAAQSDQARVAGERAATLRAGQRAALLGALRRDGELAALALAIDGALPADTWLTALALRRDARVATPGVATPGVMPGAAPAGATAQQAFATGSAAGDLLLLESHVELRGQAASYDGVTAFLARLGRVPGLTAVQLQSSGANAVDGAIDFHATMALTRPGADR